MVPDTVVSWAVTLRSPIEVHRRFGGTYRLHLQGPTVRQEELRLLRLLFDTECGDTFFLLNVCGVTS
jgi:hypothetical protein